MSSRLVSRMVSQSVRVASRSSWCRGSTVGRRTMASEAHHAAKTSDTPWAIGSAVVFGSALVYLLAPPGQKHAQAHGSAQEGHHGVPGSSEGFGTPTPTTDDEGNEVSEDEVKDSMNKAYASNSPGDAQRAEAMQGKGQSLGSSNSSVTDADGETASSEDVKKSMKKGYNTDSPKDAEAAERGDSSYGKGESGGSGTQGDKKTSDKSLDEKQKRSGTFESPEEEGPTNMGKARSGAAQNVAPREVGKQ